MTVVNRMRGLARLSCALLLLVAGCAEESPAPIMDVAVNPVAIGDSLPDITFQTLSGDSVTLRDAVSAPGLVMITAAGCSMCSKLLPAVETALSEHAASGTRIVVISYDALTDDQAVDDRFGKLGASAVILRDPEMRAAGHFGSGIPLMLLIDGTGQVAHRGGGVPSDPDTMPYWLTVFDSLMGVTSHEH